MKPEITTAFEHYERMIDEIDDSAHPVSDPACDRGPLYDYMARWDGPAFYGMLGPLAGKAVLEVGVGTGRVARNVLDLGCARLTGIDISPKTIARAQRNLSAYTNLELLLADVTEFRRPHAFDAAYSVLAFLHIEQQQRALANMVASLKPGGRIVLSISHDGEWLDYGPRKIRLYPTPPAQYLAWLHGLGCTMQPPIPLIDTSRTSDGLPSAEYGQAVATIVCGTYTG